jgi:saccharopine dehydrogenase-like NADP-dependent oxidoreductase
MKKILVSGAGLVGKAIAIDLAKKFNVSVIDRSVENLLELPKNISSIAADFSSKKDFERVLSEFDLIVGALPGFLGYEFLKTCIKLQKNVADISFCKEDVFELNSLALENNVTVVFDCGVAPGLSNIILGFNNSQMQVNSFKCYVGGLPQNPEPPYFYKAPFSPADVIEEYTRPARIVEKGKVVIKPALSERELIEFDGIGKLEAFNTDGLRSLISTMKIPNMLEKTLRWQGHIDNIIQLRDSGSLGEEGINIKGNKIKPIEVTSKLLFDEWKLKEGDEEFTVMKIIIEGVSNGKEIRKEYNLFDKYDMESKTSSMARTTGYVCTAVVNLIAEEKITQKGVIPPEHIGADKENFDFILEYLKERNIKIIEKKS